MALIQIGDVTYEATLTRQRDTLSVTQVTEKTLETLEAEFSPETSTEIRVSKRDGPTEAIYNNLKIVGMFLRKDNGVRRVTITLRVEQLTRTEADALNETVHRQQAVINEQTQDLKKQAEAIAQQAKLIEEQAAQIKSMQEEMTSMQKAAQTLTEALNAIEEGIADA